LAGGLLLAAGCPGEDPSLAEDSSSSVSSASSSTTATAATGMRASLVDHAQWMEVPASDDPLALHRPASVQCGIDGAYNEDTGLEIDTGACNYLARQQPSLVDIAAGDSIAIEAFHETLASVEAGEAHFAILVGSEVVWEIFVPIPASPEVVPATPFTEEIEVDFDAPAGTPVIVHLHNHGFNTWRLLTLDVVPASP